MTAVAVTQDATYGVGAHVRVKVPSSPRFGHVGTVEQVGWHTDKVNGAPVEYPVYTVQMDDEQFPNPIHCTDWAIEAAQEAADNG